MLDIIPTGKIPCPVCGQPSDFGDYYLGGYGWHKAFRCPSEHSGPLYYDETAQRYIPADYHRHWFTGCEIIPSATFRIPPEAQSVTIPEVIHA